MRVGSINFLANYTNKLKTSESHNAQKAVSFGEIDDGDFYDCRPFNRGRQDIRDDYNRKRRDLADRADFNEMNISAYYEELHKLDDEERSEMYRNGY